MFSYEVLRDKGLPSFRAVLARDVESAEAWTNGPCATSSSDGMPTRDLPVRVGSLPIFRRPISNRATSISTDSTLDAPVGSGPYVMDDLDTGRSVTYRHRDDYWGEDHPLNVGQNNFDTIRVEYLRRLRRRVRGLQGRQLHVPQRGVVEGMGDGYNFPAVQNGRRHQGGAAGRDDRRPRRASSSTCAARSSHDPRVREAIGLMFNFEWSNETLFYGIYDRVDLVLGEQRPAGGRAALGGRDARSSSRWWSRGCSTRRS